MMDKNAKIYVAGHRGMVGSAIVRELHRQGYMNITTRTHGKKLWKSFLRKKNRNMSFWLLPK